MARRTAGSRDDTGAKDRTLVITRIFDAPRVYREIVESERRSTWRKAE